MNVLIVGATSSLGSALTQTFSEFADVYTAGRNNCDIKLDLNSIDNQIIIPENLDAVINTTAHFGGLGFCDYLEALYVNVAGTLSLLNICRKAKSKMFLQISSINSLLSPESHYYDIYSITKKHADEIATQFCLTHSLPLSIVRPSQIYGNDNTFRKHQQFFYTAIDNAENGNDTTIYGSNDAKRNYIHIDDLTAIILRVIQFKICGTYTCTYSIDITFSEIAEIAFSVFGMGGKVQFLRDKPDIQDNIFPYNASLYKTIDYYPEISIYEGIKRIERYRKGIK